MAPITWINKPDKLETSEDYMVWSYVMKSNFEAHELTLDNFNGSVTVRSQGAGLTVRRGQVRLEDEERTGYIRAEAAMKGYVIKSVSKQIAVQLLSFSRFTEVWEALETQMVGDRTARLCAVSSRIKKATWMGSLDATVQHYMNLVTEYGLLLNGELSETELCLTFLELLPPEYQTMKTMLRKDSISQNDGDMELANIIKWLQVAGIDIAKNRRNPRRQNESSKGGSNSPRSGGINRSIRCYHCQGNGHVKRDCPALQSVKQERSNSSKQVKR